jgi:ubiquinone/menaquinone biosynthesis C-methylase UbiE
VNYIKSSPHEGNDVWETAYARFETPEEEIRKFCRRLTELGVAAWSRQAEIVELCCGRGNGLQALSRLGFTRLAGVDLSAALISQYKGPATLYVCDCRQLPFDESSKDIVIVQGGLHHLKTLPDDLQRTLSEAARVLKDNSAFVEVEPWLTPFLAFVHRVCRSRIARRMSPKINALATMIDYEQETYEQWLGQPQTIVRLIEQFFHGFVFNQMGKYMYIGRKRNLR